MDPSTHATGEPEGEQGGGFEALLRLAEVLRRRWLVVFVTAAFCVAAGVLIVSVLRPYWRAQATLVVNVSGSQVLDEVRGVNEEAHWDGGSFKRYFETQKTILRSRRVAEVALSELGLANDEVFLGIDQIDNEAERARKLKTIDPIERMRKLIQVNEVRNSRVVKVAVEYPDRETAIRITDAVVRAYLADVSLAREDTGGKAKEQIEGERRTALGALEAAEHALDSFKQEHEITTMSLADRQNLITQNILTLSTKAKAAQAERIEVEASVRQVKRLSKGEFGSATALKMLAPGERALMDGLVADRIAAARAFADVKARYLDKMPAYQDAQRKVELLDARIAEEQAALLAAFDARLAAARDTERSLSAALEKERLRALDVQRLEPEFRGLDRRLRTAGETYDVLARRDTEIGITNRVERPPVEPLDPATSANEPVRPRKLMLLAVALFGGLILGGSLAIAVDLRDLRIRGVADLERAVAKYSLPLLGEIPVLSDDPKLGAANLRGQRRNRDLFVHLYPQSLVAERLRAIRASLSFGLNPDKCSILLLTSPGTSEGKSSVAMNLALSFCQAGKRVALVDADMRRPRLHQVFPTKVGEEHLGLAAVLVGGSEVDESLRSGLEGAPELLSVATCGEPRENPAEMLESSACRRFFQQLRERFDIVIVDSPPVLPVADPLVLAREVDGVVVVSRSNATTRLDLQRALHALSQSDANMLGVVLNGVSRSKKDRGYGSSYYAYYREPKAGAGGVPAEES